MAASRSLVVRALVAVVFMLVFFAAAAGAIVALVLAGKWLLLLLPDIRGRGVLFIGLAGLACLFAAGVVAWSVLPRPDRFEPPGPEISSNKQPQLFAEIRKVANATGEAMPVHVYVVNDVNAFVAQRGGIMGIGSRRVMGLGLPLMRTLTVSELRAVIAHEFGHFYGGDTKLGPWIYKTRSAMVRTVINLEKAAASSGQIHELIGFLMVAIRTPFLWLAKGFVRVSQAVSRAQEYSADGVAVRTEGAPALINGLKKTHASALAHRLYLNNEVEPLVNHGALPPVGEGFSRFLSSDRMAKLLGEVVDAELQGGEQDPYDSHPPLRERVEAAARIGGPTRSADDRSAIELVIEPEQYETESIRAMVDRPLTAVAWSDTASYWIAAWRAEVKAARAALSTVTIATLPRSIRELRALARRVHGEGADHAEDSDIRGWAMSTIGPAIALLLCDTGWTLVSEPGAPHRLVSGDLAIEPWGVLSDWWRGDGDPDAPVAVFGPHGIADRPLT